MPPPNTTTLAFQARLRGQAAGPAKFSTSKSLSAAARSNIKESLSKDLHSDVRDHLRLDPSNATHFAAVTADGTKIITLFKPIVASGPNNDPIMLVSLSDTVGVASPASVPKAVWHDWVSVLAPDDLVQDLHLPVSDKIPGNLPGRPIPAEGEEQAQEVPPSNERLQFDPARTATVACVPRVLAIPVGHEAPGVHPIEQPFPAGEKHYGLLEEWRKIMYHTVRYNEGNSVTGGGPLFAPESFNQHEFGAAISVSPTVGVPYTMLDVASPHYADVANVIEVASNRAWEDIGGQLPPLDAPHAGGPPTPALGFDARVLGNTIVEGLTTRTARTATEVEHERAAQDIAIRFRGAFGKPVETPDEGIAPSEFAPATIASVGETVLTKSKPEVARRELSDAIELQINTPSVHFLDRAVTMGPNNIDLPLVKALRDYSFFLGPLTQASPEELATQVSVLCFLTPTLTSELARQRIAAQERDAQDGASVSDASRSKDDKRKMSELYIHGLISEPKDVPNIVANFRLVMRQFVEDYDSSAMAGALNTMSDTCTCPKGSLFFRNNNSPAIAVNLASKFQEVISLFLNNGKHMLYRRAIRQNQTISAHGIQECIRIAAKITKDISEIIERDLPGDFAKMPRVGAYIPGVQLVAKREIAAALGYATPPPGQTSTPRGVHFDSGASKKVSDGKPAPSKERDTAAEQQKGFVVWKGTGDPPAFRKTWTKPKGRSPYKEQMCMGFACVNAFCPWGKNKCKHHHLTNFGQIPEEHQLAFEKMVANNPNMSFVEGKGPSGTPS